MAIIVGVLLQPLVGGAAVPARPTPVTLGPTTVYATACNGPDDFGYRCVNVSRPYISGTQEITGTDGSVPKTGLYCDQCQILDVELPFTFTFYGQNFTRYNATADGTLQFNSSTVTTPIGPLPEGTFIHAILPYWDDLCTSDDCLDSSTPGALGNGVFVRTVGTAPNRLYIVEWRAHPYDIFAADPNAPTAADTFFEVQLEETSNNIYFVYGATKHQGDNPDGGGAVSGIQQETGGSGDAFLQFSSADPVLTDGTAVCFSLTPGCPQLTAFGANGTVTNGTKRSESDDDPKKKTEEQRLQAQLTNTGSFDDIETEGNVIEVDTSVAPPIAYIANRDTPRRATDRSQLVAIVLACPGGCATVRPGDYLQVSGEKVHEQRYIAEAIKIVRPR